MKRSPTDTLIAAMEEAEKANELLVVMTTEDGYLLTLSSTDQRVLRLGMLEAAKQWILAEMTAASMKGD